MLIKPYLMAPRLIVLISWKPYNLLNNYKCCSAYTAQRCVLFDWLKPPDWSNPDQREKSMNVDLFVGLLENCSINQAPYTSFTTLIN